VDAKSASRLSPFVLYVVVTPFKTNSSIDVISLLVGLYHQSFAFYSGFGFLALPMILLHIYWFFRLSAFLRFVYLFQPPSMDDERKPLFVSFTNSLPLNLRTTYLFHAILTDTYSPWLPPSSKAPTASPRWSALCSGLRPPSLRQSSTIIGHSVVSVDSPLRRSHSPTLPPSTRIRPPRSVSVTIDRDGVGMAKTTVTCSSPLG